MPKICGLQIHMHIFKVITLKTDENNYQNFQFNKMKRRQNDTDILSVQ